MQFASPDWQPSAESSTVPVEPEQEVPLPVNAARLGWQNEKNGSYEQEQQLAEFPPTYQQTPLQQGAQAAQPRWRRSWLWAIVFVLAVWLIPALLWSVSPKNSAVIVNPKPLQMSTQTFNYDMAHISTLNINDPNGFIHVHAGGAGTMGQIMVQSSNSKEKSVELLPGKDGSLTIQVNALPDSSPVLLDVTLPQSMALNLTSTQGDIEIDGINGQFNLKTDSSITLNQDTISGQSHLSADQAGIQITNSSFSGTYTIASSGNIDLEQVSMSGNAQVQAQGVGDIHMSGGLDARGTYGFSSNSGQIGLLLPSNTAMQLNIDPGTSAFYSEFPPNSGSTPQAQVTLKTNMGTIEVRRGA